MMQLADGNTDDLLRVSHLRTSFKFGKKAFRAVDDVSFAVKRGQAIGLVGESGCGKTVSALSLMRLLSEHAQIEAHEIFFDGQNLASFSERQMRQIRGNSMSMIFQEPMTSLNPVFSVGDQLAEVYRLHRHMSRNEAWNAACELLRQVKIPEAAQRMRDYPHSMSGGMRQRVMIAMALACKPKLLIADEPTTALDVTIQAQILRLMDELRRDLNMAMILVTHDLGVVAEVCDYVIVMYAGQIAEQGLVVDLLATPRHPYTAGLLNCIPRIGRRVASLPTISGAVPALTARFVGCQFQNRCSRVTERCKVERPVMQSVSNSQEVACWNPL